MWLYFSIPQISPVKRILFFISLSFLFACAQQVAPTGGLKDETPPEILVEVPKSESTNFAAKRIEIEFDEFVKLNRLNEQLITSPPLKYNLQTSIRGKTLRIEIVDTLKENTTYIFNFGNAIVDIHENNPIENYTYVFSTGDMIDTNRISGMVIDAFKGEPIEKVLVMAYKASNELYDSLPYLQRPDYISLSDKAGNFSLNYMQSGSYKIFALKEDNDNYLFDLLTEPIGFKEELIEANSNSDSLKIFIFEEDHEVQYLKEQNEVGPSTQLIFNLPNEEFSFSTELVDSLNLHPKAEYYSENSDTVEIWWPEMKLRFPFIIQADTLTDTLNLAIDTLKSGKRSPLKVKAIGPYHFYAAPRLEFSQPIASVDTSLFFLLNSDSVKVPVSIDTTENDRKFTIEFDRKEGEVFTLVFDSASFTDIYGYHLDSIAYAFSLDETADYGSLKVNISSNYSDQLILHLLDQRKEPLRKAVLDGTSHTFKYLKSGVYTLKLIIDSNANGQWDTGNYLEGIQPEKVINYEGEIRVRSRWDKEVDWILF